MLSQLIFSVTSQVNIQGAQSGEVNASDSDTWDPKSNAKATMKLTGGKAGESLVLISGISARDIHFYVHISAMRHSQLQN